MHVFGRYPHFWSGEFTSSYFSSTAAQASSLVLLYEAKYLNRMPAYKRKPKTSQLNAFL